MRAIGVAVLILVAACGQPVPGSTASSSSATTAQTASPVRQAACKLPVYWEVNVTSPPGIDVHAALVGMPDGVISDVGKLPQLPEQVYGATYEAASNKWIRIDRHFLSPDGTRYAYWVGNQSHNEVHVVDIATGTDRMVYSSAALYMVIAFESDALYLVHAINPRQGAFEKLYRLDPAGGTPTLVPGSDRHMDQWGWVLISDGAAWGIDARAQGNDFVYSVLRLDLATGQVVSWFEGPLADLVWPLGFDVKHRLYVQGVNQGQLWRLTAPGQAVQLSNPGPISYGDFIDGSSIFVSDSMGVWIAGQGGVWLYSATGEPKQFVVGPPDGEVWPAGPCI